MYAVGVTGDTRRGASGSPVVISPLLDGGQKVNTVHVGHENAKSSQLRCAGENIPHVVFRETGPGVTRACRTGGIYSLIVDRFPRLLDNIDCYIGSVSAYGAFNRAFGPIH